MTELTDEAVTALLAHYDLPTDCDCDGDDCVKCSHYPTFQERASKQLKDAAPDLARALLDARAELARVKADAAVAVALMVERAAENKEQLDIWAQEILEGLSFADVLKITSYDDKIEAHNMVGRGLVDVILNLAPADGLAAVEALRVEARENAMQALASMGQAQEAYEAQLEAEAERDRLAAANAALEARVAELRAMIRVNMLRYGPPGTSHEEINAAIDAALAEHGGTQK